MAKTTGDPALLEALGENIARARGRKTQGDIAKASGIDVSTISDLENGRRNPSYTTLLRLATVIGVDVVDLIRPDQPKGPSALETRIAALEKALLKSAPAARPKPKAPARKKRAR